MRRTRIVCTIGPASAEDNVLRQMMRAGMDVARLNFSHGDHQTHAHVIERLRRIAAEEKVALAILQDLQGPRLRVGVLAEEPVQLVAGQRFVITTRQIVGTAHEIYVEGVDLPHEVGPGNTILMDDGQLELSVRETTDTDVICQVVTGGPLRSRKGINVPDVTLSVPAITDKDKQDLAFGLERGVDMVAMSFVRSAADLLELRRALDEMGGDVMVVAKIEKHEAVARFDEILSAADAIMVARGDLGVETSAEDVPMVQKMVIAKCNQVGKPVITATQMLNSMTESPRPTRAEASDVANAILDGTDAVMLSAETSIGQYPVLAVKMMARIAAKAEDGLWELCQSNRVSATTTRSITDSIGQATLDIAHEIGAKAILTMTTSGYTARMVARHRHPKPIIAMTQNEITVRRLALTWGVTTLLVERYKDVDSMLATAERAAKTSGMASAGEVVVITAGLPLGMGGRTNLIKVHTIGESTAAGCPF